ncbi:hypothetical protein IQ209_13025 [Xenorhabdus sp. BG5]|nr:hypothetical protein [Xenorhabdus sp. BG5]
MYFPATKRIIFAEHYQRPYHPKGDGYFRQCRELKQSVFKPLIDYFRDARKALGVTAKDIHSATGKQMTSHWFSDSQWQLLNEVNYQKLQALFDRIAKEKQQRWELNIPYNELVESHLTLTSSIDDSSREFIYSRAQSMTPDCPF